MRVWVLMASLCVLLLWSAGCSTRRTDSGAITVESEQVYVRRGERELTANIYRPAAGGPSPGVLLVHGGSWQRGNKLRMAWIGEQLARRGYVAVSIDYRHAPEYRFPAQLHDCQAAVRWMRDQATRLRIDPDRIGAFGYSSGGHLVALLATTDQADGLHDPSSEYKATDTRLQAAVLGAAPIDLRRFPENRTFVRLLGASATERPDLYAQASPITFVTPDDPPMFLYHGSADWLVDATQSQLMLEALRRVQVPAKYFEIPRGHYTTFLFDDGQVGGAIDFLDHWLQVTSSRGGDD